jgi:hypothetical protein
MYFNMDHVCDTIRERTRPSLASRLVVLDLPPRPTWTWQRTRAGRSGRGTNCGRHSLRRWKRARRVSGYVARLMTGWAELIASSVADAVDAFQNKPGPEHFTNHL